MGVVEGLHHASPRKKISRVLALAEEQAMRGASDPYAEEVAKGTKVLLGELSMKEVRELSKKTSGRCCEDDVVNIHKKVG